MRKKMRFPPAGSVEAHLTTDHGVIQTSLTGDFFSVVEPRCWRGVGCAACGLRAEPAKALADETVSRYFSGLENGELIELLLSQKPFGTAKSLCVKK